MPVYNSEDFLKDSLNSILNQTFSDLELICVDDGSTDDSLAILNDFADSDSRVKVFALDHLGGGNARNFGLKHIKGEYLYLMDSDDILDLNAFEDFYSISKSQNLDFLIFKAKRHDVDTDSYSEIDYYTMPLLSDFVKDNVFSFKDIGDLIFKINVAPWCKFYNTKFILGTGAKFREGSKFHDNQFFWDIIFQAERILFLDEFYYTQNVHSKSLTESCDKNHIDIIDVLNGVIELFVKHNQFDNFKEQLFNDKVYSFIQRYDDILDEYKEPFYSKMKEDFQSLKYTDFRNCLHPQRRFLFDSVLISKDYQDFNLLKEIFPIFTNSKISFKDSINAFNEWYSQLDDEYKKFFFDYSNFDLSQKFEFNLYNYKISIIIPVFNVEDYLENAFNSLLNQTIGFENLEIIFVDDASTDNSPQIIKEYSDMHDNVISIFLYENSGNACHPRNVGMNQSTSDYFMFLDPEEILLTNACELLYDNIVFAGWDMVSGFHCEDKEVPQYLWKNISTGSQNSCNEQSKNIRDNIFKRSLIKIKGFFKFE